jgi:eukaryotic-like serine/threonine-protein kinase
MKLCINPWCKLKNSDNANFCEGCQTKLLIQGRYSVVRNLCDRLTGAFHRPHPYTDVYEILDTQDGNRSKVLKVLKVNDAKLIELFEREQRILTEEEFRHPGIVKGEEKFSFSLFNNLELPCIVMEKIPGQDLQKYIENNDAINQNEGLYWLKQLVTVLDFLHNKKQIFHRDIKPPNIIRRDDGQLILIDFNAAREITETVFDPDSLVTKVHTPDYAAPEQLKGHAVPQSDFYSLGRTFIYLFTGQSPSHIKPDISHWSSQTKHPISNSLVELINSFIEDDLNKRPQNYQNILQRLDNILNNIPPNTISINKQPISSSYTTTINDESQPSSTIPLIYNKPTNNTSIRTKKLIFIGAALGLISTAAIIIRGDKIIVSLFRPNACESVLNDSFLSCGEKSVVSDATLEESMGRQRPIEKENGMNAFREKNYPLAQEQFQIAWNKQQDPETLIYLNNSRIINSKIPDNQVYTISVVAPLKDTPEPGMRTRGLESLRGIAQAQDDGIKKKIYLRVIIGDDGNEKKKAQKIAEKLGQNTQIKAVIGHYASDITTAALPIYQKHKLVLISPTSTSDKLKDKGYFFRVIPEVNFFSEALAKYLYQNKEILGNSNLKVAIFGTPTSVFSESLSRTFKDKLGVAGDVLTAKNVPELDLSSHNFNVSSAMNKIKELKANAIVLAPDPGTTDSGFNNAIQVLKSSSSFNRILVGNTFYRPESLIQEAENRLVSAVAWYKSHPINQKYPESKKFLDSAASLWENQQPPEKIFVTWITAHAYDATLAIEKALLQQPSGQASRESVLKALSDPGFEFIGATGKVKFDGSDRLAIENQPSVTLIKIVPHCSLPNKRNFIPVDKNQNCFN